MSAVSALPLGRPITRDDLDAIPDDGHRYELIDGSLLVSPAPSRRHQDAVLQLGGILQDACPRDLRCYIAPFDVVLQDDSVFEPDVLIANRADLTDRDLPAAPVLAVEVVSPSTRAVDQILKYARYAQAGVAHYWIVDPDEPSLTAWRLGSDGAYAQVAHVTGDQTYEALEPVRVNLVPSRLVADA